MAWYEIANGLLGALGAVGGVAGVVAAIKAFMFVKEERKSKDLNNRSSEIDNLLKIIEEIRSENTSVRKEFHDYKDEVNGYVADFKHRFAIIEKDRDNFKMATMEAYRCRLPKTLEECPVVRHLNHTAACSTCEYGQSIEKEDKQQ